MIVVIDTNVWVSALHFASNRGTPRLAIEKAVREDTVAICRSIEDELLRILTGRFGWKAADVAAAVEAVLPFPLRTKTLGKLHVCRDPNDDMVLECAVVSGAQVIVSGDKDLLVLGSYQGIRIVTPAEYLSLET
jgi:putative PIN family toxin of toxin-antitoxin system